MMCPNPFTRLPFECLLIILWGTGMRGWHLIVIAPLQQLLLGEFEQSNFEVHSSTPKKAPLLHRYAALLSSQRRPSVRFKCAARVRFFVSVDARGS